MSNAWTAMLAESTRTGLPSHYKGDLDIDRDFVASLPEGSRFLWALRECGTHLVRLDGTQEAEWVDSIATVFAPAWYLWTGDKLLPVADADSPRRMVAAAVQDREAAMADVAIALDWGNGITGLASVGGFCRDNAHERDLCDKVRALAPGGSVAWRFGSGYHLTVRRAA